MGTSRLSNEDLALLVHNKDTAGCSLGCLLQTDCINEGLLGVAEKGVRQLLLLLEGRVGLGRVRAETEDGESVCSEGCVCVAEEAYLLGACASLAKRLEV